MGAIEEGFLIADELEHEGKRAIRLFHPKNRTDVGMVERRQHARFALEAGASIGIADKGGRQDLDRDVAPEPRVAGAIDLAIPPAPIRSCTW